MKRGSSKISWRNRVEPICFRRVWPTLDECTQPPVRQSFTSIFNNHGQQSLLFFFHLLFIILFCLFVVLLIFIFHFLYFCLFCLISVSCALNQMLGKGCRSRKFVIATHWKTVILLLLGKIKTDTGPLSDLVFRFQSYRSSSGEL